MTTIQATMTKSKQILESRVELKRNRAPTRAKAIPDASPQGSTKLAKVAATPRCTNTCHQA